MSAHDHVAALALIIAAMLLAITAGAAGIAAYAGRSQPIIAHNSIDGR